MNKIYGAISASSVSAVPKAADKTSLPCEGVQP
jgi:hypothetical protein